MKTTTEKQDVIAAWDYCKKDMIETLVSNKNMKNLSEVFNLKKDDNLLNERHPTEVHHEAFLQSKKSESFRVLLENSTTLNEFLWLCYSCFDVMKRIEENPEMAFLRMIGEKL